MSEIETTNEPVVEEEYAEEEPRRKKGLLALLLLLLLLLCGVSALFIQYINEPEPLPAMITGSDGAVNYPPHYLYSIYGVERPVGIAISPDGSRLYVAESAGERMVRIFDPDGNELGAFTTPQTAPGERSPVYLSVDPAGRVYVTDRTQHAIYVYDADGNYLDSILSPELTLNEYITKHAGADTQGMEFSYNVFRQEVFYQLADQTEATLPAPDRPTWAPLGVWISPQGTMLLTDVAQDNNAIRVLGSDSIMASDWADFSPEPIHFGATGQGDGEFLFPNDALVDSQGRVYVSDGNNGRISIWDSQGSFQYNFGVGTGDGALSLPRGMDIDANDRLYVADAVGQHIVVYDVSGENPVFLYAFGSFGMADGQFNYPNDIVSGPGGRLYIVDRENNRIQVWLY